MLHVPGRQQRPGRGRDGRHAPCLEREPPGGFHVLALDAFAGDAVPTHLLTAEAMELYARHLAPEGVLAVHVSNRTFDLAPAVVGSARRSGFCAVDVDFNPSESGVEYPSRWILCARAGPAYERIRRFGTVGNVRREVVWTDDRSSLLPLVQRPPFE